MRRLALAVLLVSPGCAGPGSSRPQEVSVPRVVIEQEAPSRPVKKAPAPAGDRSIDLQTALRLAGARNLDIEIVESRLAAQRAVTDEAFSKYLPDLRVGFSYLHHDGLRQDSNGLVTDQAMSSFGGGPGLELRLDPVEARFEHLRALQLEDAVEHQARRTRAEVVVHSAILYLELVRAAGLVAVAQEAVGRSQAQVKLQEDAAQLQAELGVELARARAELARDQEMLLAGREALQAAGIKLATWLRLPPQVQLIPQAGDIEPLTLVPGETEIGDLLDSALAASPDLAEMRALSRAAAEMENGAKWGPWIPEVFAAGTYGTYAGGAGSGGLYNGFGDRSDFSGGLTWTLKGLGLGDRARQRQARAEALGARLQASRTREILSAEVVTGSIRSRSLLGRIAAARQGVEAAEETLKLIQARFEAGDVIQLEVLEAIRAVAAARAALVDTVVTYNQIQHLLHYRVRGSAWGKTSR